MKSNIIKSLNPEFGAKIIELLEILKSKNIIMVPYYGLRSVKNQATLWCRGRNLNEINEQIQFLKITGFINCADLLKKERDVLYDPLNKENVSNYDIVTKALPGASWHNYGEAIDCFLKDNETNIPIWDSNDERYEVYANTAQTLGLTAGYYFRMKDAVHIQHYKQEVDKKYTKDEIENFIANPKIKY